jgi:hypothetical protein
MFTNSIKFNYTRIRDILKNPFKLLKENIENIFEETENFTTDNEKIDCFFKKLYENKKTFIKMPYTLSVVYRSNGNTINIYSLISMHMIKTLQSCRFSVLMIDNGDIVVIGSNNTANMLSEDHILLYYVQFNECKEQNNIKQVFKNYIEEYDEFKEDIIENEHFKCNVFGNLIQKIKNILDKMINNIKIKDLNYTTFGNSIYSELFYVDNKNKTVITFTPRSGCSKSFCQYLDLVNLLDDGISFFNEHIHHYRIDILNPNIEYKKIDELIKDDYQFIKFIMNPYIRAVSIYILQDKCNLTFREFLKYILTNKIDNINNNYHIYPQYIDGEERVITKYIKINENETYSIKLSDDTFYELNANRYYGHFSQKTDNSQFCGDIPKNTIITNLPKSYKNFYDDEIKNLVDTFYKNDVEKYGFSFENF